MEQEQLEDLIAAAGASEPALRSAITALGSAQCAELALQEIALRCAAPAVAEPVVFSLDLVHDAERLSYQISFAPAGGMTARQGGASEAVMHIEYRLDELIRELYGPVRAGNSRRLEQRLPNGPSSLASWRSFATAMHEFSKACSAASASLSDLAVAYDSDKWGSVHWFAPHYERHFERFRDQPIRLLEIGIGGYGDPATGGGSLHMWRRYFPRALIYGLDIFRKSNLDSLRLRTLQGDQSDPEVLAAIARRYGPFDVIIDDGSHVNQHVLTTFSVLLEHVRPRGFYVIEDLWTSYCSGYGGVDGPTAGPDTSLGLVKRLVDAIHYEEPVGKPSAPPYEATHIVAIHLYHNLVFFEKGTNAEGGIPEWVGRTPY